MIATHGRQGPVPAACGETRTLANCRALPSPLSSIPTHWKIILMTTVEIKLSDSLAKEAKQAGLLTPEAIETMLRERLRAQRVAELREAITKMASSGGTPMTMEEIEAEIQAYRQERRRAAGV